MKLMHPNYESEFLFEERTHFLLIIENPLIFRTYTSELFTQINGNDGEFILTEGIDTLSIDKNIDIISDFLHFEAMDKKVSNKINSLLKSFITSEFIYDKTLDIITKLEQYSINVIEEFPYSISYDQIDTTSILRAINFKLIADFDSLLEKIAERMKLCHDICNISVFIFINAFSFLALEEIELLIENANLEKNNLLFIESHNTSSRVQNVKKIIIDADGCEIF